jgi:hypothetical protein
MTAEQIASMTYEEKRVAIAKAIGIQPERRWRFWYDRDAQHAACDISSKMAAQASREWAIQNADLYSVDPTKITEPEEYDEWFRIAPKLNDLNACAQMEETLTEGQKSQYVAHLSSRISEQRCDDEFSRDAEFDLLHSSAAQRCEAFLMTI